MVSTTGIITTIVGTSSNGYVQEQASEKQQFEVNQTQAKKNKPRAVWLDSKVKLYVSEGAYVRSIEYTPTAVPTEAPTVAPSTSPTMNPSTK